MRFMNSRALRRDELDGDIGSQLQDAVDQLETELRASAAQAQQNVVSWSVSIEYRADTTDGEVMLVPAAVADAVHIMVVLNTTATQR